MDSLLLDYNTRGTHSNAKEEQDDWYPASGLQVGAAMRLLYYFPTQTAPLIARRLAGLRLESIGTGAGSQHSDAEMKRGEARERANGVNTTDFIKAVSWSPEPPIRAAILSIFQRAGDVDVLLAALPSLDRSQWPLVSRRLGSLLFRLAPEDGWGGDGYNILVGLRTFGGEKARPMFQEYLRGGRRAGYAQRCFSLCEALKETSGEWDQELLIPLLSDRRPADGYTHAVKPNAEEPRLPIRVCDAAAETLCAHRKDLKFEMVGSAKDLDQQIRRIQQRLSENAPSRK
jgi:hypothetical protein